MSNLKLIPMKEIDLESLPKSKPLDAVTLYETIKRGVKNAVKPWDVAQELENPSRNALQTAYDIKIKRLTDDIMTVIISELYIKP